MSGTIFSYALFIGVGFAVLTFIASNIFNFGESDAAHEVGGAGILAICLPGSPLVWSFFLIIGGGAGEIMTLAGVSVFPVRMAVGIIVGYGAMVLLNKFLWIPLKRAKYYANSTEDIIGAEADVFEAIPEGENRRGAVQVKGQAGSVIYSARSHNGKAVSQGTKVRVVSLDEGEVTVMPEEVFFDEAKRLEELYS